MLRVISRDIREGFPIREIRIWSYNLRKGQALPELFLLYLY